MIQRRDLVLPQALLVWALTMSAPVWSSDSPAFQAAAPTQCNELFRFLPTLRGSAETSAQPPTTWKPVCADLPVQMTPGSTIVVSAAADQTVVSVQVCLWSKEDISLNKTAACATVLPSGGRAASGDVPQVQWINVPRHPRLVAVKRVKASGTEEYAIPMLSVREFYMPLQVQEALLVYETQDSEGRFFGGWSLQANWQPKPYIGLGVHISVVGTKAEPEPKNLGIGFQVTTLNGLLGGGVGMNLSAPRKDQRYVFFSLSLSELFDKAGTWAAKAGKPKP